MNALDRWMLPMLCDRAAAVEGYDPDAWAAEAKIDGWRAICHVGQDVKVYGGRNGSDYSGQVPYLEAALRKALPPDSCVDGELMSSAGWGGVQGAMTRAGCGDDSIILMVFDVLRVNGQDVRSFPWSDRRRLVEQIQTSERLRISPLLPPTPDSLEAALQTGFEGLVLKRKSSRYVNGRSPNWVKVKPQQTAEAIVTGFKPGEGSFAGLVGALEFKMLDTGAQSRCSGFDLATRREITANPDRWLGQMIEIKHHGLGREGKPRHPQFLRRRDDRLPQDWLDRHGPQGVITQLKASKPTTRRSNVPYRQRNYAAMGDAKLVRCVHELQAHEGDAYERCVSKGGNPDDDLTVARAEAQGRGLV